jgi:DNA-binding CsgD family transcriptional regulator
VAAREREQQAFELRKSGASPAEIGRVLQVSRQAVHKMLRRVLARLAAQTDGDALEVRQLEASRLDTLMVVLWKRALTGHEGAVDRVLKIMQRRAELLGLDVPQRREHTGRGGGPIPFAGAVLPPEMLKKLSEEQLDQLEQILTTVGGGRIADPVDGSGREGPAGG